MEVLVLLLVVASTIWVYFDAKSLKEPPGAWVVGCLLLWIVCFPMYLAKRKHFPTGTNPLRTDLLGEDERNN